MNAGLDYYGDNDPSAGEWLRALIEAGELPEGAVDGRSIRDVQPGELRPFRRVHLFAGIGGWGHALGLAGWPT
jgi:DNA (cytosine-5)-methyltransferase 1